MPKHIPDTYADLDAVEADLEVIRDEALAVRDAAQLILNRVAVMKARITRTNIERLKAMKEAGE